MTDLDEWDDEPCEHDCYEDGCDEDYCSHGHCWNCGACRCPGYCDDFQTYNLRPGETGGSVEPVTLTGQDLAEGE